MSLSAVNLNNQNNTDGTVLSLPPVPTNKLQALAIQIRDHPVNWQTYLQSQMIQPQDFEVIREFDLARTPDAKRDLLNRRGDECARTFISLMTRISKEKTVQYILTLVDDMLVEDPERTRLFCSSNSKKNPSPWVGFMNMLNRPDKFTVHQASRIISKLACWGVERMSSQDLTYYLNWIKTQLASEASDFVQSILSCLQMMLRVKEYRIAFFEMDGMTNLQALLNTKCGFQVQYQTILCIWLMTFTPELSSEMARYHPVPLLADILGEAAKEKVTRIVLATFRNLVTTPEEADIIKTYSLEMIHFKVLKHLEILEAKQFADEDLAGDVEFLIEHLSECLQDVSSFDEYYSEVVSERLEWSPVHKSEKFWRENAARLNEKNHELLKILTKLMETSQEPVVLAVATHDVGEYVRHCPRGKKVVDQLGTKQLVMQHLAHPDSTVKYNALIAVQKMMVHNWEYLGKQLATEE